MAVILRTAFCMFLSLLTVEAISQPDSYYAKGSIQLPYAGINEPFEAWLDGKSKASRIDYYGGSTKIYSFANYPGTLYGRMFKIVPVSANSSYTNVETCFTVQGFNDAPIDVQPVIPNVTLYTFSGTVTFEGSTYMKYESSLIIEKKVSNYTYLLRISDGTPARLEFVGFDRLFGSHYDEYIITYDSFKPLSTVPPGTFKINRNATCIDLMPGMSAMAENPFFELVGSPSHSQKVQSVHIDRAFAEFKDKHRPAEYKDEKEHVIRRHYFHQNYRFMNSVNRRGLSYTLAVNHMTDYSDDELKMLRGYKRTTPRNLEKLHTSRVIDVPDTMNWWLRGAVTPVKDQAICGSCWAFGTTGTIEGSLFMKTDHLVSLSEQAIVDCAWGFDNNGCDGGTSEGAYQWIIENGCLPTEDSYGPYFMQDGMCHVSGAVCGVTLTDYKVLPSGNVSALVLGIYESGPISIAIDASLKTFSFYSDGVYYDADCGNTSDDLDHQVLAVGYGILNSEPYFLVKNSWSTHWGNDGYILMSQRDNNCGVATDASFAILQ